MPPLPKSHWNTLQSAVLVQEPDVKLEVCHSHQAQVWLSSAPLPRLVWRPCTAPCQGCSLVLLVGPTAAKGQSSASTASSRSPWHSIIFLPWHTSLHTQHVNIQNIQKNNHVTNWMSHAKGQQSLLQQGTLPTAPVVPPVCTQLSCRWTPGACTLLACKSEPVLPNLCVCKSMTVWSHDQPYHDPSRPHCLTLCQPSSGTLSE